MRNSIERYRQLCAKGLSVEQIAIRLGVNKNTVYQNCKRHRIAVGAAARSESPAASSVKSA